MRADPTPFYLRVLLWIILFLLAGLILHWIYKQTIAKEKDAIRDGFETNMRFTYIPDSAANKSISFGLADLEKEAQNVCAFLKMDNKLVVLDLSNDMVGTNGDYSVPVSSLELYAKYQDAIKDPRVVVDASYASVFKSGVPDDQLKIIWASLCKDVNELYTQTQLYIVDGSTNAAVGRKPLKPNEDLESYFLNELKTNSNKDNVRNAWYAIMKPILHQRILFSLYESNIANYINIDGSANNHILYVLNTCSELMTSPTLATDISSAGIALLDAKTTNGKPLFTVERIKLFQTVSLLMELHAFIIRLQASTIPKVKQMIRTRESIFVAGFPKYLNKIQTVPIPSVCVFALEHRPNLGESGHT